MLCNHFFSVFVLQSSLPSSPTPMGAQAEIVIGREGEPKKAPHMDKKGPHT